MESPQGVDPHRDVFRTLQRQPRQPEGLLGRQGVRLRLGARRQRQQEQSRRVSYTFCII